MKEMPFNLSVFLPLNKSTKRSEWKGDAHSWLIGDNLENNVERKSEKRGEGGRRLDMACYS